MGGKIKSYVVGIESFRIPRNLSSLPGVCNPRTKIVYEPVLPHFDWIAGVLSDHSEQMCLSSEFRLIRKELIRFSAMIAASTVVFFAFLIVRCCWSSGNATVDDRTEGSQRDARKNGKNQISVEKSVEKMNLPKILRHGSVSQSTD